MTSPTTASSPKLLRQILALLRNKRGALAMLALLLCLTTGAEVAVPFVTRSAIDLVVKGLGHGGNGAIRRLLLAALGVLILATGARAIRSLYNYRLFRVMSLAEDEIKNAAFRNFLRLDTAFQNSVNTGEVIGAFDRGGTAIFVILNEILGQNLLPSSLLLAGVLAVLLGKNPWMAALVFLPLPAYALAVGRLSARMHQLEFLISHAFERVTKESFDIASNVRVVKKFGREAEEADTQRHLLYRARNHHYAGERLWAFIENVQSLFSNTGRVLTLALGGYLTLSGRISLGDYVLFLSLQDMVYGPVSQLSILLPKLRRNLSRAERLLEILKQPSSVRDSAGARTLAGGSAEVVFENITFTYSGSDRPTLRDVSVCIPAGKTVALIGPSGSGKSTLMHLLQRLYDVDRGRILIDGHDIRELTQASLRQQIAVVPQEVELFSRTIAENIGYGRAGVTREQIVEAARLAEAHEFISRCEKGYDTPVGERGLKLSGGERQRLGIARAVVGDPKILILDEATSHLDNESERLIQRALEQVTHNRTCFIIAHRLSTVRNADLVVVFGNGTVEAVGTHDELWQTSHTFRRLHALAGGAPAGATRTEAAGETLDQPDRLNIASGF